MGDLDLTAAIEAAAEAVARSGKRPGLADPSWHYNVVVQSMHDRIRADAETAVRAAAEVIAEQVRKDTADTIARAIDDECRKWADGSSWGNGMDRAAEIAREAIARRAGDGDGTATTPTTSAEEANQ